MFDAATLAIWVIIFRRLSLVAFLGLVGFGPGFVVGMLLSNRFFGRALPIRMEVHQQNARRAAEHNKQWDPNNPRWEK